MCSTRQLCLSCSDPPWQTVSSVLLPPRLRRAQSLKEFPYFAEQHHGRAMAFQCKLESQNEALVPNKQKQSPCHRRVVLGVTRKAYLSP